MGMRRESVNEIVNETETVEATETEIGIVIVIATAIVMGEVVADVTTTMVLENDTTKMMGTTTRDKSEGIDFPQFALLYYSTIFVY